MKSILALFLIVLFVSCKGQSASKIEEREIVFENISNDTTVIFYGAKGDTLNIFRKIEIIENNNTDTVVLGYAIIPPGFHGNIFFIQDGMDKSKAVYINNDADLEPTRSSSYAKLFTLNLWNSSDSSTLKRLKIKIKLKTTSE